MTANVTFVYAEKADVVRVPNASLRFRAPPSWPTQPEHRDRTDLRNVWVVRDGKPQPVTVRIGIGDGTVTELIEGPLTVGEALVTDAGGPNGAGSSLRIF
jgi:HlyD family secretion protein